MGLPPPQTSSPATPVTCDCWQTKSNPKAKEEQQYLMSPLLTINLSLHSNLWNKLLHTSRAPENVEDFETSSVLFK